MGHVLTADELVTAIGDALRAGMDAELRATGGVLAPTVHLLTEDLDQPYVGSVTCRPFHRGEDAATAITELGVLPSVLSVTRLVVGYEAQDLNVAVEASTDPDRCGLVVLDAALTGGHELLWCPLRVRDGEAGEDAVLVAAWGEPVRLREPPLPRPIAALLAVWREQADADLNNTVIRLESSGHRVHWSPR